jgi:hypothetical protein
MPITDSNTLGPGTRVHDEDTAQSSFDAGVRGFTGLLVGLAIGMAAWGLVLMVWWLV